MSALKCAPPEHLRFICGRTLLFPVQFNGSMVCTVSTLYRLYLSTVSPLQQFFISSVSALNQLCKMVRCGGYATDVTAQMSLSHRPSHHPARHHTPHTLHSARCPFTSTGYTPTGTPDRHWAADPCESRALTCAREPVYSYPIVFNKNSCLRPRVSHARRM